MASVSFPYYAGLPVVEVEFTHRGTADAVVRRLLVDSGFSGQSAFVLPATDEALLALGVAPVGMARGAVRGEQRRVWVVCAVQALGFRRTLMAISTDPALLPLPSGADRLAGLTFLQQFVRWGGERDADGRWAFVLAAPGPDGGEPHP
jgi:hypothetical protein